MSMHKMLLLAGERNLIYREEVLFGEYECTIRFLFLDKNGLCVSFNIENIKNIFFTEENLDKLRNEAHENAVANMWRNNEFGIWPFKLAPTGSGYLRAEDIPTVPHPAETALEKIRDYAPRNIIGANVSFSAPDYQQYVRSVIDEYFCELDSAAQQST